MEREIAKSKCVNVFCYLLCYVLNADEIRHHASASQEINSLCVTYTYIQAAPYFEIPFLYISTAKNNKNSLKPLNCVFLCLV